MRQVRGTFNAPSVYLLAFFICTYGPWAAAQSYVFRTVDDPNAAAADPNNPPATSANGINDFGVIVGSYSDPSNISDLSAFQFSKGDFSTIDFPGACCGSEAVGINNSGEVVGDYNDDVFIHGYTVTNGNYATLDFPGAVVTVPTDINNHGVIVGSYQGADNRFHGFSYNGAFSSLDCATGASFALVNNDPLVAVNDFGDTVGTCGRVAFKFTATTGQNTPISFPGAFSTGASGINDLGQVVGHYLDGNTGLFNGFLFFNGNYQTIDFPGATNTFPGNINNLGEIVGQYEDAARAFHGFVALLPKLVDPVPDLLSGNVVRPLNSPDDAQILANKGKVVQGVAADGVAEVVVRIPAFNVGDQFTVTVMNDGGDVSGSSDENGAVGNPGDTTFSQHQVAVTAVATTDNASNPNPTAFAVYRAPIDFARPTSSGGFKSGSCITVTAPGIPGVGSAVTDNQSACRTVTLNIAQTPPHATEGPPPQIININLPVIILRPPLVLIHGLWSSWRGWDNFKPLVSGPGTVDSRFSVGRVNYDNNISDIVESTNPFFLNGQFKGISSNSLGFAYNAEVVQTQIEHWIEQFKSGTDSQGVPTNPLGIPAAGIQADIVGHSLGGLIARTIAGQDTFLGAKTFAQGDIHKLITIDTPHLGSPIAIEILSDSHGEDAGCVENVFASSGEFPLNEVDFNNGATRASGAVADLEGDDTTGVLSGALAALVSKAPHPLPTALIAGIYQNFQTLDAVSIIPPFFTKARFIRADCVGDPLAAQLTSTGWPAFFHGNANDAIVSETSQLAGLDPSFGFAFSGFVHSQGIEELGFANPSVLDGPDIPTEVILLLNQPVTTPRLYNLLTP